MKSRKLKNNEDEINFIYENNNKEKILFIHGFSSSIKVLENLMNIKDRNYDLISLDLPGHGQSTYSNEISMNYLEKTIRDFVKNIGINEKIVIMGHSMGGALATFLDDISKKIILINPLNPFSFRASTEKFHTKINEYKNSSNGFQITNLLKLKQKAIEVYNIVAHYDKKFHHLLKNELINQEYQETVIYKRYLRSANISVIINSDGDKVILKESIKLVNERFNIPSITIKSKRHNPFLEDYKILNYHIESLLK